jgi:large repetitive protein
VTGTPFGQNRVQLGVGTKFQTGIMTIGIDYSVMFGVSTLQQGVRLTFSMPF